MAKITDETLMAYVDGELLPPETAAIDAQLAADPALRMRIEPFLATRRKLAEAFEPTLSDPVPDRLVSAILNAPSPRASGATRPAATTGGLGLQQMLGAFAATLFPGGLSLATAASVALLVSAGAIGGWLAGQTQTRAPAQSGLIAAAGSGLAASGELAAALEGAPSVTPAALRETVASATALPLNTFRTKENGLCREYRIRETAGKPDYAGLACRAESGAWRLAVHVETPKQQANNSSGASYGTASSPSVPAVDAVIGTMIAGDVFGPEEERTLRESGWHAAPSEPQ